MPKSDAGVLLSELTPKMAEYQWKFYKNKIEVLKLKEEIYSSWWRAIGRHPIKEEIYSSGWRALNPPYRVATRPWETLPQHKR